MNRIEVRIDRVVLDGVGNQRQARAVREALHDELAALFAGSARPVSRRERSVRAPGFRCPATGSARELAQGIARSVFDGVLGKEW